MVLSGQNEKGSTPPESRAICMLKRGLAADVSGREGGGGPPDFPRHRRPRCIAPCGGVVWLAQPIAAGCEFPRHGPRKTAAGGLPAPIPGVLDKAAAA